MARFFRVRGLGLALFAAAILAFAGCAHPTGTVKGKVTYSGKVVKGGSITFVSTEGHPSVSGSIKEDGTYIVEKVPAGSAKVCVETESLNPAKRTSTKFTKYGPPPGQEGPEGFKSGGGEDTKNFVKIPASYSNPETTTLSLTVSSGEQEFNVELK